MKSHHCGPLTVKIRLVGWLPLVNILPTPIFCISYRQLPIQANEGFEMEKKYKA